MKKIRKPLLPHAETGKTKEEKVEESEGESVREKKREKPNTSPGKGKNRWIYIYIQETRKKLQRNGQGEE
jgi:hypothetical protein